MGLGDDVKATAKQIVTDVASPVVSAGKQIAQTPLEVLEEMLGGNPALGKNAADAGKDRDTDIEKGNDPASPTDDAAILADIEQKKVADQEKTAAHLQLHRTNMKKEEAYLEQQQAEAIQKKQVEEQQKKEEEQYEILQLQHERKQDLARQVADDAANTETQKFGAG